MSQQPFEELIPSGWGSYLPELSSIVRGGLNLAAGAGIVYANTVSASEVTVIASVMLWGAANVWGLVQKWRAKRQLARAVVSPSSAVSAKLPA